MSMAVETLIWFDRPAEEIALLIFCMAGRTNPAWPPVGSTSFLTAMYRNFTLRWFFMLSLDP